MEWERSIYIYMQTTAQGKTRTPPLCKYILGIHNPRTVLSANWCLHCTITISFLLVGHTKSSPDWCFGLFKQRYRCTFVSSLEDVVNVVDSSADANVARLVGTQSGETVVPMYRWNIFLTDHFQHVWNPTITSNSPLQVQELSFYKIWAL